MRKGIPALLCILPAILAVSAAEGGGGPGSSFGEALRLAVTARTMAMGGAHAASSDGVHALAVNPAGMLDSPISTFHVTHTFYVAEIDKDYLAYTQQLPAGGSFGVSLFWLRSATVTRTLEDENGNWAGEAGEYTVSSGMVSAGYAAKLSSIVGFDSLRPTGGAALRVFQQQVDQDRMSKMTADFGFKVRPTGDITVAAVLQNYATKLKDSSAPMQFVTAAAWRKEALLRDSDSLTLEADIPVAVDGPMTFSLGSEYTLRVGGAGLAARLGIKRGVDVEGTSGMTSGLGFRWLTGSSPWGMDYSFMPFGSFGSVHAFSLTFCLGR